MHKTDKLHTLQVNSGLTGQRLDVVLGVIFPQFGLRARRRLWEWCKILVDGKACKPGFIVTAGQIITVIGSAEPCSLPEADQPGAGLRLLASFGGYAAVFKPAGLASAKIAGSKILSAEELIHKHWETLWKQFKAENVVPALPLLCNRLDTGTSGILLLAFSEEKLEHFRVLELQGMINKYYFALVHGHAPMELDICNALNMENRKRTLLMDYATSEQSRHTKTRCLSYYPEIKLSGQSGTIDASLLEVIIKRGARHQIRAHLAGAGFPIVGDSFYAEKTLGSTAQTQVSGTQGFYLHHFKIVLPGFYAVVTPDWPQLVGMQDILQVFESR